MPLDLTFIIQKREKELALAVKTAGPIIKSMDDDKKNRATFTSIIDIEDTPVEYYKKRNLLIIDVFMSSGFFCGIETTREEGKTVYTTVWKLERMTPEENAEWNNLEMKVVGGKHRDEHRKNDPNAHNRLDMD